MEWIYQGTPVKHPPVCAQSFVYRITNTINSKMYIGKKSLVKRKLKTSGNRKSRIIAQSDWREYYGSNKQLLEDIQYYGEVNFIREILHWCKTKGDANYLELKEQILNEVLEREDYYNVYIGSRIHANHLSCNKKKPHN